MISCNKGHLKVEGGLSEIQADVSTIVHGLKEEIGKKIGDIGVEMFIRDAVDAGLMTEKQLQKEILKMMKEIVEMEGEDEDE